MKLVEISEKEWNEIDKHNDNYFSNGCVFDEETDNLIAFCWYKDAMSAASKYYKVVENQ